jgi:transposase InsO family protein
MMHHPSSYLRMRVLGAIDLAPGRCIRDRIKHVSGLPFLDEDGLEHRFTWRTIQTWLSRFKKHGVTGIQNHTRSDKGATRKISPEQLLEALNQVLPFFRAKPRYNRADLYRRCIELGLLRKEQLAPTTFYRFIHQFDLLKQDPADSNARRLAFAMQYANQLWQADTMYGPYITGPDGTSVQTRLIAFLDDASRLCCHAQFFLNENVDSLVAAIRAAFYKRGVPEQLYVDNGSIYTCAEITLICARVGCILRHAPLRDGAAKGKVERFFRTVRDSFLSRQLDLSSLDCLDRAFTVWVEDEYNSREHSAIGMKPIDRFGLDLKRIRFLPPDRLNDELFFAEDTRKVKKDNTFSFNAARYEAPADLRDRSITIRFDRSRLDRVIVFYKETRIGEAKPLDLVANGLLKRCSRSTAVEAAKGAAA